VVRYLLTTDRKSADIQTRVDCGGIGCEIGLDSSLNRTLIHSSCYDVTEGMVRLVGIIPKPNRCTCLSTDL
jgi:hypothetical protein